MPFLAHQTFFKNLFVLRPNMRSGRIYGTPVCLKPIHARESGANARPPSGRSVKSRRHQVEFRPPKDVLKRGKTPCKTSAYTTKLAAWYVSRRPLHSPVSTGDRTLQSSLADPEGRHPEEQLRRRSRPPSRSERHFVNQNSASGKRQ